MQEQHSSIGTEQVKLEDASHEEDSFEKEVMESLQGVPLNPRAEQPEEFFQTYSKPGVWIPLLLLYLMVLTTFSLVHPLMA